MYHFYSCQILAEANTLNNALSSTAEPTSHKSLRKFRELCNNNKQMLKAITAFSFQDYAKLKEDTNGNQSLMVFMMMSSKSNGSINVGGSSRHRGQLSSSSRSFSDQKRSANAEDGYSSTGSSAGQNNGTLSDSLSSMATPTLNSNLAKMGRSQERLNSAFSSSDYELSRSRASSEVEVSQSEKHKMLEEFQKRLDFDIQMPFDDE
jgi:hypothetical protein